MTMVKVPIQKRPAKEPVEEEDKDAKEKEKAMAACEKIAKVDCKYFNPNKHKARAGKKAKMYLTWGIRYTAHLIFLVSGLNFVFFGWWFGIRFRNP